MGIFGKRAQSDATARGETPIGPIDDAQLARASQLMAAFNRAVGDGQRAALPSDICSRPRPHGQLDRAVHGRHPGATGSSEGGEVSAQVRARRSTPACLGDPLPIAANSDNRRVSW